MVAGEVVVDTQKRMLITGKLASIGEMAAGIAHEINNPLQTILLNLDLMEGSVDERGQRQLGRVRDSVLRIKEIVRDLLVFAKEQKTVTEDADLNGIIEKTANIIRPLLKVTEVNLRLDLSPEPVVVRINSNLFQQVILNLLQNAKDAIEGSGKGSNIRIKSAIGPDGAEVSITDDGPGIPEENLGRIFDPFFTTKEIGTGLGLSLSRKIIEGMGGTITAASSSGQTAFNITLARGAGVKDLPLSAAADTRGALAAQGA